MGGTDQLDQLKLNSSPSFQSCSALFCSLRSLRAAIAARGFDDVHSRIYIRQNQVLQGLYSRQITMKGKMML